jgi:dynein heavy chain, axonemal
LYHICNCVIQITFASDLKITEMISSEGEKVPFTQTLYPEGNVEDWLLEVENVMRESLRQILSNALEDYKTVSWKFSDANH